MTITFGANCNQSEDCTFVALLSLTICIVVIVPGRLLPYVSGSSS